jgi:DNA-3-methyladenine glycosylase II
VDAERRPIGTARAAGRTAPPERAAPAVPPEALDTAALTRAAARLARHDPDLARLLARDGTPPLWARPAGFATLVKIILEQQVSLASARAIYARLRAGAGRVAPAPLLALGDRGVRRLGLTRQKTAYVLGLAEAVRDGGLDLDAVAAADDDEARAALVRLKGIGRWTADIYLLMALGRPDVWPTGDIALERTVRLVKRLRAAPSPERIARIAEVWRPHRSVAARMLWHHYLRRARR